MTPKYPFLCLIVLAIMIAVQLPVQAAGEDLGGTSAVAFNDTVPGERNVGQVFTWSIQNVSKQADIKYYYTVYASRLIGMNYSYYSNAWGRWEICEAGPGFQYLVIWVRGWTEGTTSWGYGPERFRVFVWDNLTIDLEPAHLNDLPVWFLADEYRPVVNAELENRTLLNGTLSRVELLTTEWYGWRNNQKLARMESGLSNAWDGVILYQIPVAADLEDLRVAGWFGYYGTPVWYLTPHMIVQKSFEAWQKEQQDELSRQKAIGLRVSDRQADRGRG